MAIPLRSKILITGSTGFLGGRALECLRTHYDITATGRNEEIGMQYWNRGIKFIPCDLSDRYMVDKLCQGQEYVINCAGNVSSWGHYQDYYQSNVQAVSNIIDSCKKNGISRLIHVSTATIYSSFQDRLNIKENFLPSEFMNDYAATKNLAERLILEACDAGFDAIILRPSRIFGPGDFKLIPKILKLNLDGFFPLMNNGRSQIDMCYVDNVVDAIMLAADASGRYRGRIYNISNGQPLEIRDLVDEVCRLTTLHGRYFRLPYPIVDLAARYMEWKSRRTDYSMPNITRYDVALLGKTQTLNIERAKKELGYYPRVSNDNGLARFSRWWNKITSPPSMPLPSSERMKLAAGTEYFADGGEEFWTQEA